MKLDSAHELKKKLDDIVEGNGKTDEIKTFLAQEEDTEEDETLEVAQPTDGVKRIIFTGLFFFFCAAAAMTWIGYTLFGPHTKSIPPDGVRISIDKEDLSLSAGSEAEYHITYLNTEKNPMTDIVLILEYPTGFSFKDASLTPKNTQKNYWEIGTLKTGEQGTLTVKGAVMGRKDEEKQFFATLYYRPTTMNTQFVVKKSWKLRISSQPISFEGPSETTVGDQIEYVVSYADIHSIGGGSATLLHVDLPQSFLIREITPKPDGGKNSWTLETLLKHADQTSQHGSIKISGVYQEGAKGTMGMRVSLESPNGGTKTSSDLALFQTKVHEGEVEQKDDISVKLVLNNSSSDMPITLGKPLDYTILLEHGGIIPVQDIKLQIQFKNLTAGSTVGQWKSGLISGSSKEIHDTTLEWTAIDIPEFSLLNPGEKVDVNFQFYMPKKSETSDAVLEAVAIVSGIKHDPKEKDSKKNIQVIVSSNSIKSPVNSDFTLMLDPVISDNELIAEKQKTYRMSWTLSNSLHELEDLKISARVPSAVVWLGNESFTAGEMRFDQQSRQILWTLNRLPVSVQKISLAFDLGFTPIEDDLKRTDECSVRKPIPLLSKIIASATDTVAKGSIQSEQSVTIQGELPKDCKKE